MVMISEAMYALGAKKSCIRELFEYGMRQSAVMGAENVYDFSIGNPSIPAPQKVKDAFVRLLTERDSLEIHGYTPAAGRMDAREAIAEGLNRRYNACIRPQNIFFTCGAAPALVALIRALAVDEAEILAIAPYFPEYRPFVESNGIRFTIVPADTDAFQISFSALEAQLTPHTQAVIVNSPNNPSGVVYTEETLRRLGAILKRKSREYGRFIYIIADEPYRELAYDGVKVPFIPSVYPDTVVCYSFSKSLSLPGERIGYICVPDCVAESQKLFTAVAGAARTIGHVCAPSLLQLVAAEAVRAGACPDLEAYDRNRVMLYEALTSYGYKCVKPTGAFYMFIKAPNGDAAAFSELARGENLLIVPGGDFGCPEFFRISTCVAPEMIERSLPVFKRLIESI